MRGCPGNVLYVVCGEVGEVAGGMKRVYALSNDDVNAYQLQSSD
jgi:hypothetical protein